MFWDEANICIVFFSSLCFGARYLKSHGFPSTIFFLSVFSPSRYVKRNNKGNFLKNFIVWLIKGQKEAWSEWRNVCSEHFKWTLTKISGKVEKLISLKLPLAFTNRTTFTKASFFHKSFEQQIWNFTWIFKFCVQLECCTILFFMKGWKENGRLVITSGSKTWLLWAFIIKLRKCDWNEPL